VMLVVLHACGSQSQSRKKIGLLRRLPPVVQARSHSGPVARGCQAGAFRRLAQLRETWHIVRQPKAPSQLASTRYKLPFGHGVIG